MYLSTTKFKERYNEFIKIDLSEKLGMTTIFVYFFSFFIWTAGLMYSVWLGLIALLIRKFFEKKELVIGNKIIAFSSVYIFIGTLFSDLININLSKQVSAYDDFSKFLMYFVLLNFIVDKKKFYFFCKLWIVSLFISYFGIIKNIPDIINKGVRLQSFYGIMRYSHMVAGASTILLAAILFFKKKKGKEMFPVILVYLISIPVVFFTKTRGAWLAVMIPQTFLFLFKGKKIFVGLIILCSMIFVFIPQNQRSGYVSRVKSITNTTSNNSNLLRLEFWKASIYTFSKKPLFGAGTGGMGVYYKEYFEKTNKLEWVKSVYGENKGTAHSTYMSLLGRHGLLVGGYIIFFMLIILPGLWIRNYKKISSEWKWIYWIVPFGSTSFYISCLTENVLTAKTGNLFILMMFLFGYILVNENSGGEKSENIGDSIKTNR